jgi:hypothetical protein
LVTNDKGSGSSKNVRAQKLGVMLINEDEFITMIGGLNKKEEKKIENKPNVINIISESLF